MPTQALTALLVALGVACRLVTFYSNYKLLIVPMAGLTLFAAARLPRRQALLVPILTLFLADLWIDYRHAYSFEYASRLATYVYFALLAAAGAYVPRRAEIPARLGFAAAGETLFWLASNFLVWAEAGGFARGRDVPGLAQTYLDALPFYGWALGSSLIATAALFGAEAMLQAKPTTSAIDANRAD